MFLENIREKPRVSLVVPWGFQARRGPPTSAPTLLGLVGSLMAGSGMRWRSFLATGLGTFLCFFNVRIVPGKAVGKFVSELMVYKATTRVLRFYSEWVYVYKLPSHYLTSIIPIHLFGLT